MKKLTKKKLAKRISHNNKALVSKTSGRIVSIGSKVFVFGTGSVKIMGGKDGKVLVRPKGQERNKKVDPELLGMEWLVLDNTKDVQFYSPVNLERVFGFALNQQ